jgi:hypothetical protein
LSESQAKIQGESIVFPDDKLGIGSRVTKKTLNLHSEQAEMILRT